MSMACSTNCIHRNVRSRRHQKLARLFRDHPRRLKPGGKAAIQTIAIDHERFDAYRRCPDFIQHYIFPGGVLPSPAKFLGNMRSRV